MTPSPSLWNFLTHADLTVKIVIFILLTASLLSWTFILQRLTLFKQVKKENKKFETLFWSGVELNHLYEQLTRQHDRLTGLSQMFYAGFSEFLRLSEIVKNEPQALLEGTERAMQINVARQIQHLEKHLSFLATVGSTGPYIGLLGTVWGIMNAFQSLSTVEQATISLVAPGISQALIATSIGLFTAIPAVIGYNRFANELKQITQLYDTFQEEFINLLHRKIYS